MSKYLTVFEKATLTSSRKVYVPKGLRKYIKTKKTESGTRLQ